MNFGAPATLPEKLRNDASIVLDNKDGYNRMYYRGGAKNYSIEKNGEVNYYTTLAEACSAAESGETIKVLESTHEIKTATINKNLLLNLQENTISIGYYSSTVQVKVETNCFLTISRSRNIERDDYVYYWGRIC